MDSITFISIYDANHIYVENLVFHSELYDLLLERQPNESISHKKMPTRQEHFNFIASKPYKEWCIVTDHKNLTIGSYYITHQNEIGISVFFAYRRRGYATRILDAILQFNPGVEFKANINPVNEKSKKLFRKFGFKHVQDTFVRGPT